MTNTKQNGLFSGPDSLINYLDPASHPYVPLVELPESLNPFYKKGVRIYAKMMTFLPLGNVKSVPAYSMINDSDLSGVREIVEASSGNTVVSVGIIARQKGVNNTTALVSKEVTMGKLKFLRLTGLNVEIVDVPICPDPNDPNGAIETARKRGEAEDVLNLGQYDNGLNPGSHSGYTGPQIYEQLDGKVDVYAAGLGTTGTLVGVSSYLRKKNENLHTIGIARMVNNNVPGVRTKNLLKEVAFSWRDQCDSVVEIDQKTSYEYSLMLIRSGLLVGPSSGFALAGLLKGLEELDESGALDPQHQTNAVFICPDGPLSYVDEYFNVLGDEYFPEIKNVELLAHAETGGVDVQADNEVEISLAVEKYINVGSNSVTLQSGVVLVDVREANEFEDHHIENSILIPLGEVDRSLPDMDPSNLYIFVCRSGARSMQATLLARDQGLNAFSLKGGTTEWSALSMPRVKSPICK